MSGVDTLSSMLKRQKIGWPNDILSEKFSLLNKFSTVVCFLLGNSTASEFCMPTYWNTLSVPSSACEDGTNRVF